MYRALSHWAVRLQGPTFSSFAVRMFEALLGLPFSFSLLASSLPICSSMTAFGIAPSKYHTCIKDKPCLGLPPTLQLPAPSLPHGSICPTWLSQPVT